MASRSKRKRSLNSQINEQIRRIRRGYTDIQQRGGVFSQSVEEIIRLPQNPNASTLIRLKRISKNDLYRLSKTREGLSGWKIRNRRIAEAQQKAKYTREAIDFYQRRLDELDVWSSERTSTKIRDIYKQKKGRLFSRKKQRLEDFARDLYTHEQAYSSAYYEDTSYKESVSEIIRQAEQSQKQYEADKRYEDEYNLYQIFIATQGVIVDPYYDNDELNLNSFYRESNREYALRRGLSYQYDDFYEWKDKYLDAQRMKKLYDDATYFTEEPEPESEPEESEWQDRADYDDDGYYSSLEDEDDEAWGYQNFSEDVGDSEAYSDNILDRLYHELDKGAGDTGIESVRAELENLVNSVGKESASQYLQNHEEELMDCVAEVINYLGNIYAQKKSVNRALIIISGGNFAFYNSKVNKARSESEKGTKLRHLSINTVDENEEYY